MTHEVIRHLLDDYVTGDLDDDARALVGDHIAACAICASEVEALERLIARAKELPGSVAPPAEGWSNIKTIIERDQDTPTRTSTRPIRFWQRPTGIAAAVFVAAILSSSATYLYVRGQTPPESTRAAVEGTPATLAAFTVEENDFLRTAAALQDVLDQQESALAPETVAQLKASLRTIDEAILEARNALARDPANKLLIQMVSSNYRQKIELLRRTTELTRGS